jgi:hypothetical protein
VGRSGLDAFCSVTLMFSGSNLPHGFSLAGSIAFILTRDYSKVPGLSR